MGMGGRRRDIRVEEDRVVGPRRADGNTVSVHAIAGDAAARRRPREGDPRGGHAGGLEAGGGGGGLWRRGGRGMGEGAPPRPGGGGARGGRFLLGPPPPPPGGLLGSRGLRNLRPRGG